MNSLGEQARLSQLKIWPDVRSAPAASGTDETRLKVVEPNVIRPGIGAGRDVMRAVIVAAINAANAGFAHFTGGLSIPHDRAGKARREAARKLGPSEDRAQAQQPITTNCYPTGYPEQRISGSKIETRN